MGCEADSQGRLEAMKPYQVNETILEAAKKESIFMHCMPAHPGEEVSQAVLDSDRAILFDQAENRLHMQKAILAALSKFNSLK
jgi:ornithine carbamoyltransferase